MKIPCALTQEIRSPYISRMPDKQKIQEFLREAEDIIQNRYRNLLKRLYSFSDDFSSTTSISEVVHLLFQAIHTLKGISSICGFEKVTILCHSMEDMLDKLRLGRLKMTEEILDILVDGMDIFMGLLKDIHEGRGENIEVSSLVERIKKVVEKEEIIKEVEDIGEDFVSLSDYERHRISENLKKGVHIYKITANLPIDTNEENITTLENSLKNYGEVIALIPVHGYSRELTLDIVFASKDTLSEYHLKKLIPGSIVDIQHMTYSPIRRNDRDLELENKDIKLLKCFSMSTRIDMEKLDSLLNHVGEIFLLHHTIADNIGTLTSNASGLQVHEILKTSKRLSKKLSTLRDELIEIRLVPIGHLFDRISWLVDKLCRKLSRDVNLEVHGHDTKLDKSLIEGLQDSLVHIIRNSIYHGIEDKETRLSLNKPATGTIWLRASHRDSRIIIEIEDDGRGIDVNKIREMAYKRNMLEKKEDLGDKEILNLLFSPGFTTKDSIDDVSGRGIGLDIVARNISSMGGIIDVDTTAGQGTKFTISLPVTMLLTRAMIVIDSGQHYAIPFYYISENCRLKENEIISLGKKKAFNIRGDLIPLIRLRDILKFGTEKVENSQNKKYIVIVGFGEKKAGIIVDKIKGQREILIKPSKKLLLRIQGISGFTEIDLGNIVPVIDVSTILDISSEH